MAEERTIQVTLTARGLRWLLEQIGCTADPNGHTDAIRGEIEDQLERALFELEERE